MYDGLVSSSRNNNSPAYPVSACNAVVRDVNLGTEHASSPGVIAAKCIGVV